MKRKTKFLEKSWRTQGAIRARAQVGVHGTNGQTQGAPDADGHGDIRIGE